MLQALTSIIPVTVPQTGGTLSLAGHEAKIISVDYDLTSGRSLVYSTAEVLALSTLDAKSPLLVLWSPSGSVGEFLLSGVNPSGAKFLKGVGVVTKRTDGTTLVSISSVSGASIVKFADGLRVIVLDKPTAYATFVPSLSTDPSAPAKYNLVVTGPSLVRSAKISGTVVTLTGDLTEDTTIEVFAPLTVTSLTWNGRHLSVRRTRYGSLIATSHPSLSGVQIGSMSWRSANGLPESAANYNDSRWKVVNATNSPSIWQPETLPPLFAEDQQIWMGTVHWRGQFKGTTASGVYLSVSGGNAVG